MPSWFYVCALQARYEIEYFKTFSILLNHCQDKTEALQGYYFLPGFLQLLNFAFFGGGEGTSIWVINVTIVYLLSIDDSCLVTGTDKARIALGTILVE